MQQNNYTNALGLDIGDKRIGVARINSIAKLPEPLITLSNDETFIPKLMKIIEEESIDLIVVGLPRNMDGQETAQSKITKDFVESVLRPNVNAPIIYQDETLSSVEAKDYPQSKIQSKGLDAIAAAEILRYYTQAK